MKGKVIGYSPSITVVRPKFVVSERGRQRVIASKRKNVHAGVVGEIALVFDFEARGKNSEPKGELPVWTDEHTQNMVPITYNPYAYSTFVHRSELTPVFAAEAAIVDEYGVTAFSII